MTKIKYLQLSDRQEALDLYGGQLGATELIYKAFNFWNLQNFRDATGKQIPKSYLRKGLEIIFKKEGIKFIKFKKK